jgi:hypothetical protein
MDYDFDDDEPNIAGQVFEGVLSAAFVIAVCCGALYLLLRLF